MVGNITLELTKQELHNLAEVSALTLTVMTRFMSEGSNDKRALAWHHLLIKLLEEARKEPSIAKDMEFNPDLGCWFFNQKYVDKAFYSDVMAECRATSFWAELVSRMAEQSLVENLGSERTERLSCEERTKLTSSLEKALWYEVMKHGIERMFFVLPPRES